MTIKVLWAVKIGDLDWKEQVITETTDDNKIEKAKAWASNNGYDRFRILEIKENNKHDFMGALK